MKLSKEVKVIIGEDGEITLREPSNKEWNDYAAVRLNIGKKGRMTDTANAGRVKLFDKLVTAISNIQDDQGEITMENVGERLPDRIKTQAILHAFEADEVDVKN